MKKHGKMGMGEIGRETIETSSILLHPSLSPLNPPAIVFFPRSASPVALLAAVFVSRLLLHFSVF